MEERKNIIKCPFCKSVNVTKKKIPMFRRVFESLSFGLISADHHSYYCGDCDGEWKMVKRRHHHHHHNHHHNSDNKE